MRLGEKHAKSWRRLLWGLWYCGRRLKQVLQLHWDRCDRPHLVGLDGKRPQLCIPAEHEKGGRELLIPIQPDFAVYLRKWPPEKRCGRTFRPTLSKGPVRCLVAASKTITKIGEEARNTGQAGAPKVGREWKVKSSKTFRRFQ
jgi:integrase